MAGSKIAGLTIEIGGDTTLLTKSLTGVNQQSKDLQSELKQVERLLKLDPSNTQLLEQKQKLLADSVGNTKNKLDTLKTAEKQVQEQFKQGKVSEEQYRALQREVIKTEENLKELESQAIKANAVLSKDEAIGNLKNIGAAAAAAGIAVGAAFVGMGIAAVNSADELQRQSDVTGLSAERLQELAYAGANLGVELDTITGAQAKLTKSMFAAKDGTGAQADAFKALGINVVDSNGQMRDAKDVMNEAFTALNGVGNETDRDALAMQIFGKSAMEMNPLIKAGGDELKNLTDEARKNGAVMSDDAVAGLDAFGDTIDNIKTSVLGGFGEKFAEILPSVQGFLDKLMLLPQWINQNATMLTLLGVGIGTITVLVIAFNIQQALMASGTTLWAAIAGVGTAATTALGAAFAFLTSPIGLVILAIGAVIAIGVLLYQNWDAVKGKILEAWDAITAKFAEFAEWLGSVFATDWSTQFGALGNIFNAFLQNISNIWAAIKLIFGGIIDFIKAVFTGDWQGAWEAVVNIFKGIFELLVSYAKAPLNAIIGMLNAAIDGINTLISGLNRVKFDIPDWVPKLGGKSFGINIPAIGKIPLLAKGGVLSRGSAIVGEAGAELLSMVGGKAMVTPLTSAQKQAGGTGITINQTNHFGDYKPRDGAAAVRDLNRKLGRLYV